MSSTPYSAPPGGQTPAQDNTLKIVLIVLGVLLLVMMLVCGGLITAGYFIAKDAAENIANEFGGAVAGVMAAPYLESPEAKKALGRVVAVEAVEGQDDEDFSSSKMRIIGTNGSGILVIEFDERGRKSAQLIMDDGHTIELPIPEYEQTIAPEEVPADDPAEVEPQTIDSTLTEEPVGAP